MPIISTLEPLMAGDASAILREELRQAAWIVLVGTADRILLECLRGVSAPVLVVEPDQELLEQRAEAAAALGLKGMVFLEQVVGATGKDVSWYRYNDARLNGLEPLAALKPRYPNLSLESVEVRRQISLAELLQAWEPASVDGGVLVLPKQAGLDWLDGAVHCLRRLRALAWQGDESWPTPLHQKLNAVLADCWLVQDIDEDDALSWPVRMVWRRDSELYFQATVLAQRDELLTQVQLLEDNQVALVAERDGARTERDALSSQVAVLEGEKASLVVERDGVRTERDALSSQVAVLEGEKASLVVERDGVRTERDALSSQVAVLEGEKASLVVERDGVRTERDALSSQVAVLEGEKASLVVKRDAVRTERDALSSQVAVLEGEKASLVAERDGLRTERDALISQVVVLEGEKASLMAERNSLQVQPDRFSAGQDALRSHLISPHNDKELPKTNTKTLLGKEGFLFLINDTNAELDAHISGFDPRGGTRDFAHLAGHFLKYNLIVFPDKSVICRDMLPAPPEKIYRPGIEEVRQLIGDRLIDPTPILEPSDYYKTDTHMNLKGLLKCAGLAMAFMGIPFPYKSTELRLQAKRCILSEHITGLGDLTWPSNLGTTKIDLSEFPDTYYTASCIKRYFCGPATAPEITMYSLEGNHLRIVNADSATILSWDIIGSHVIEIRNDAQKDDSQDLTWLVFYDSSLTSIIDLVRRCCSRAFFVKDKSSKIVADIVNPDRVLEFRTERFL